MTCFLSIRSETYGFFLTKIISIKKKLCCLNLKRKKKLAYSLESTHLFNKLFQFLRNLNSSFSLKYLGSVFWKLAKVACPHPLHFFHFHLLKFFFFQEFPGISFRGFHIIFFCLLFLNFVFLIYYFR